MTSNATYMPADFNTPPLFSQAAISALAGFTIYLILVVSRPPHAEPEWKTQQAHPSLSSSGASTKLAGQGGAAATANSLTRGRTRPEAGAQPQDRLRGRPLLLVRAIRLVAVIPFISQAALPLLLSGLGGGNGQNSPLQSLVKSLPLPSQVMELVKWILPPPPPVGYPRLNPVLFTLNTTSVLTLCFAVACLWLRRACFTSAGLDEDFTFNLRRPSKLRTGGMYRYVQHPSYSTGLFGAMAVGAWFMRFDGVLGCRFVPLVFSPATAHALPTWINWAPTAAVAALALRLMTWRVRDEEAMLKRELGKEWEEWHARTARFIPFIL